MLQNTKMAQIAAQAFGISLDKVHVGSTVRKIHKDRNRHDYHKSQQRYLCVDPKQCCMYILRCYLHGESSRDNL